MAKIIKKQPDGLYTVRVWATHKDEFGKRKSKQKKNIKTVTAAEIIADKLQEELDNYFNNDLTFRQLSDLYFKNKLNMSETTKASYNYTTPIVLNYFGKLKAKDINTRIVQTFINEISKKESIHNPGKTIKSGTIKRHISYLKAVINWGVSQDYLEYNRIKRLEYPQDNEEFTPTIISAQQIGEILIYLKQDYYNIYIPVLLDSCLGTRRGESLGLTWDCVDFENDLIYIRKNLTQANNQIVLKNRLKTAKSKRTLALSPFLKEELQKHQKFIEFFKSDFVCLSPFTGKVPNPSYVSKTFHKAILNRFNINMRLHDLRHCFNYLANENETDIITMLNMLGHTSVKTNLIYGGFSAKKTKTAVSLISEDIEKGFKKTH